MFIPLDIYRKSCLASVKTEGVVGRRFKKAYSSFSKFNDVMYKIMLFYQGNVVSFIGGAVPIVIITTRKMQIFLTLNLFMFRSTLPYPGTQEQYEVRMLRDTLLKLSIYVLTFLFSQVCLLSTL